MTESPSFLYLFVEGTDDERFFRRVFESQLREKGVFLFVVRYSRKPEKHAWVARYARSIESMGARWIFVTDLDKGPCVPAKKDEIRRELAKVGARNAAVVVVVKEIESWYLAGLSEDEWEALGLSGLPPRSTEKIDKEQFNRLIPRKFETRTEFMQEILNRFSQQEAVKRNRSFAYCLKTCDC